MALINNLRFVLERKNRMVVLYSGFRRSMSINILEEINPAMKLAIEQKWSKRVYGSANLPVVPSQSAKKSMYVLSMFPYPSGRLHLGHVRVYTLGDVIMRYNKLQGREVFHPMGWDAFGLPAENAARDKGIDPAEWTRSNIRTMREQIVNMGCLYNWESELATCDPEYYRWTQWLFLKLFEKGLAYRKKAFVFWDPIDQTVLAEEQVDSQMRSWRSGAIVEKKLLSQWFIRTTEFAKELNEGLDAPELKDGWRDIIDLQKHWIGKIAGYYADSEVYVGGKKIDDYVRLWVSSPEVLEKAQFAVLRPDHYLVQDTNVAETFSNGIKRMTFHLRNPHNNNLLPVYMCDAEISPIVPESSDCRVDEALSGDEFAEVAANEGSLDMFRGIHKAAATHVIAESDATIRCSSLKLRDWLVSRQRKWGTPIPVVNCSDCGTATAVDESLLPFSVNTDITGLGCSNCGSSRVSAETDTLDTFFDSSWYFFRYLDSKNSNAIFDPKKAEKAMPVDVYIGGKEHACLHLYYARFMTHFLHQIGLSSVQEPFKTLIPIGIVKGESYQVQRTKKYLTKDDVTQDGNKYSDKESNLPVVKIWEKMSKSKLNGVDPEDVIKEYGLDLTRLLSMADVAPTSARKWTDEQFGAYIQFQRKLWMLMGFFVKCKEDPSYVVRDGDDWVNHEQKYFEMRNECLNALIFNYNVTYQMNVIVTRLQSLVNEMLKIPRAHLRDSIQFERALGMTIISLYPIVPAFSAELWNQFRDVASFTEGEFNLDKDVWLQKFPTVDPNFGCDLIVSVDRGKIGSPRVPLEQLVNLDAETALDFAFEDEAVAKAFSREHCKVVHFAIDNNYRAILKLRNLAATSPPEKKKKRKKEKEAKAQ